MSYVIGVDGGNTKTVAIMADLEGRVVGTGRTGSTNWEILGEATAATGIAEAIRKAMGDRAELKDIRRIHLGLAGIDWPDDEARLRAALEPHLGSLPMAIENDSFLAVRASTREGMGITVSSGSGVCASYLGPEGPAEHVPMHRNGSNGSSGNGSSGNGSSHKGNGFGAQGISGGTPTRGDRFFYGYFAELGGGIDIDARTMQAIVRAEDGRGPATAITDRLLAATHHQSVAQLLYAITRQDYTLPTSATRRALFSAARDRDPAAVGIVTGFAKELALLATNLIRRKHLSETGIPVVASGSLFTQTGHLMFSVFEEEVQKAAPHARTLLCRRPPAAGAVRAALDETGVDTQQIWEQFGAQFDAPPAIQEEVTA